MRHLSESNRRPQTSPSSTRHPSGRTSGQQARHGPPPTCEASRDIEVRLDSIESLLHRLLAEKESTTAHKGPASPPVQSHANNEVLDQIARKVNSIEQKVLRHKSTWLSYPTPFPSPHPGTGKRKGPRSPTRHPSPPTNRPETFPTGSYPPRPRLRRPVVRQPPPERFHRTPDPVGGDDLHRKMGTP